MKAITFFTILFFISSYSYSQWDTTGQNVYHFGYVGINDSTPSTSLEVKGKAYEDAVIKIKNDYTSCVYSYAGGDVDHYHASFVMNRSRGTVNLPLSLVEGDRIGGIFARPFIEGQYRRTAAIQMYIGGAPGINSYSTNIRFETTGTNEVDRSERMRIKGNGNVGIGTSEPIAKLEVADGDVFISDIERGIVMKSPDGQCWRGTVNNDGQLIFLPIDCSGLYVNVNETQITKTNDISIFPNPTENYISIKFDSKEYYKLKYIISDVNGRKILKGIIRSTDEKINISRLVNGIYFISINDVNEQTLTVEKLIKK